MQCVRRERNHAERRETYVLVEKITDGHGLGADILHHAFEIDEEGAVALVHLLDRRKDRRHFAVGQDAPAVLLQLHQRLDDQLGW